jgi:hypothetical protein
VPTTLDFSVRLHSLPFVYFTARLGGGTTPIIPPDRPDCEG